MPKPPNDAQQRHTPEQFFAGKEHARALFECIRQEVDNFGSVEMRVSTSQIAFRRGRNFALVWMPGQYLKGPTPPLVLTILLPWRDDSLRWKEVVESYPGRFTHHLELYASEDIDEQVRG
jgi:hypothetical protein